MQHANRLFCALSLVLGLATMHCAQASEAPQETQTSVQETSQSALTIGTTYHLPSTIYGTKREINVYVPPMAKDDAPLNVLYVLDGGIAQDFHHISGLAQLASISGMFDKMIVVGIKTDDRYRELTTEAYSRRYRKVIKNAGGNEEFRTHIANEVIPFIESQYAVGSRRAVLGESLAGFFIMDTFLNAPEVFHDYISVSPSLWWNDMKLAKTSKDALSVHDYSDRRIFLTMADEGGTMQEGLDLLLTSLKDTPPAGLRWTYDDRREQDNHATIYHGAALKALIWLYKPASE